MLALQQGVNLPIMHIMWISFNYVDVRCLVFLWCHSLQFFVYSIYFSRDSSFINSILNSCNNCQYIIRFVYSFAFRTVLTYPCHVEIVAAFFCTQRISKSLQTSFNPSSDHPLEDSEKSHHVSIEIKLRLYIRFTYSGCSSGCAMRDEWKDFGIPQS